jgi:transcriptional regulator with XRE-family HTH domain
MEAKPVNSSRSRRFRPLSDLPSDITPGRAAFAAELRRGRDNVQLSLEEMGRRVYASKASVCRWLAGQSLPSAEQAGAWARACGTSEALTLQLLAAAAAEPGRQNGLPAQNHPGQPANGTAAASPPQESLIESPAPPGRRRLLKAALIIGGSAATVSIMSGLIWRIVNQHHAAGCHARYPLVLQIPPQTGTDVGVTVEAVCAVPAGRDYLVMEKLPDVDRSNPHPVYFVKAVIPHLNTRQVSSRNFVLKEPVGTSAEFWVISVDNGGWQALHQNNVVDAGSLFLPSGTIQESRISWHKKGWQ